MNTERDPFDPSLMNLDSGIFDALPRRRLPLELFHLDTHEEPVPVSRPRRHDSLTPSALDAVGGPPAVPRRSAWVFGLAIAAGAGIAVGGALRTPDPASVPAARVEQAPAIQAHGPVLAAAPAPPPVVEAQKAVASLPAPPRAFQTSSVHLGPTAPPAPVATPVVSTAAFDRSAAAAAVARAGKLAGACGEESGTLNVPVALIFSPSGRVTTARVTGGSLVGTPAGGCVAAALRGASVPAFAGEPVTVSATVRIH